MGFIRAMLDSVGGTFADQWLDFYAPISNYPPTCGIIPGTKISKNGTRGSNVKGNDNIISNNSKILVPEGLALVTVADGEITGIITEPGGYEFTTDDINSKSIFAGDGLVDSLVKSSWEKFKRGGIPATQQSIFYVNLKEIPRNKFGTQSEIYWDDAFLQTQVGAVTRGTYSLRIIDPILFIKNLVPSSYLLANSVMFDFDDMDNECVEQLFNEVVGCLAGAFSRYTNDPDKGNRMSKIQGDQVGFAKCLGDAIEEAYAWKQDRGIEITKTAIISIEYDESTKSLLEDAKKADALSGARGNSFFQQSVARGIQAMGENGGQGMGMAFMGMGLNATNQMAGSIAQPNNPSIYSTMMSNQQAQQQAQYQQQDQVQQTPQQSQPAAGGNMEDVTKKLIEMKKLLDAGIISQEEFDKIKRESLGL